MEWVGLGEHDFGRGREMKFQSIDQSFSNNDPALFFHFTSAIKIFKQSITLVSLLLNHSNNALHWNAHQSKRMSGQHQ